VVIPDNVASIGECAFRSCTSLVAINIPKSVDYIGSCAFENCNANLVITCRHTSMPDTWSSDWNIDEFEVVWYDPLTYTLLSNGTYEVKAKDTSISGAISIPSLYNGKAVTSIATSGFYNCTKITSIYINGTTMTTIKGSAFAGCSSLTKINIPSSVTQINSGAFASCSKLTSITMGYKYWRVEGAQGQGIRYITSESGTTSITNLTNTYCRYNWYRFYAPVISATLNTTNTGVAISIQNKNSVSQTATISAVFTNPSGTKTKSVSVPSNDSMQAGALAIGSTFDSCTITAYFNSLPACKGTLNVQGTGGSTGGGQT
jgi:hypothetical protein